MANYFAFIEMISNFEKAIKVKEDIARLSKVTKLKYKMLQSLNASIKKGATSSLTTTTTNTSTISSSSSSATTLTASDSTSSTTAVVPRDVSMATSSTSGHSSLVELPDDWKFLQEMNFDDDDWVPISLGNSSGSGIVLS